MTPPTTNAGPPPGGSVHHPRCPCPDCELDRPERRVRVTTTAPRDRQGHIEWEAA